MRKAVEKNARLLALFAIACTVLVGIVNLLTKDKIIEQQKQQLITTLNSLIDPNSFNNTINNECIIVNHELLGNQSQKIYLAKMNDQPVAAALTTIAPDGYNGNIEILVAVNFNGSVNGVRVLQHKETPGLGDKVELRRSNWVLNFTGKKILGENDNRWAVAKDGGMFDQFTGATITPRAVVNAVKRSVTYFNQHKEALFQTPTNCQEHS